MPKNIHIVALGSSFAAGPGIEPIENGDAGRSHNNYAHQLCAIANTKRKWKATLTDLTVSGATTLNILNVSQRTEKHVFPPQLDSLPEDAEIVTVTCGGNNIGYIGSLITESLHPAPAKSTSYIPGIEMPSVPTIPYETLIKRIEQILDTVHKMAPKARVYLVQYLTVLGDSTKPNSEEMPLAVESVQYYEGVAAQLARSKCIAAANRDWVEAIPVAERSRGHGLGSERPWVTGLKDRAPLHPNYEGHRAIAEMLYQRIFKNETAGSASQTNNQSAMLCVL